MAKRVPCSSCGKRVLPATIKKTGGLCMPCFKKAQKAKTGQVFLSYRREGGYDHVVRIAESLRHVLPSGISLFLDENRLQSAKSWSMQLHEQLSRSHALVAIVDPTWASSFAKRTAGSDVVAREIEWALDNKRAVLPVLVGGAKMPSRDELPRSFAAISRIQAMTVRDESFSGDVTALAQRIQSLVTEYGDAYSAAALHHSVPVEPPAFYIGAWEVEMRHRSGEAIQLRFVIRDGTLAVNGTYTLVAKRLTRNFTGDYTLRAQTAGQMTAITAIRLDGFVEGLGSLRLTIPVHDKRGDTYVGSTEEGFEVWAKRVDGW